MHFYYIFPGDYTECNLEGITCYYQQQGKFLKVIETNIPQVSHLINCDVAPRTLTSHICINFNE